MATDLGRSMTGATYAALPMGPQLNNYRDLVDEILKADPASAPALTAGEEAIIATIAKAFPTNPAVYAAAHRETIWQQRPTGAIILYSPGHRPDGAAGYQTLIGGVLRCNP